MSAAILWYAVVGGVALALTRLFVKRKRVLPPPKPEEPPRWHKGFDDAV